MICGACRTDNLEHRRFCRECGTGLVVSCQRCSFVNTTIDRYCGGCGGELAAGERFAMQSVPRSAAPKPIVPQHTLHALPELDLSELLPKPQPTQTVATVVLPAKVSQADLDRLFQGGQ